VTIAELGALAFTTRDSGAWYDKLFFFKKSMIIFILIHKNWHSYNSYQKNLFLSQELTHYSVVTCTKYSIC
jgi:hypothetical protein